MGEFVVEATESFFGTGIAALVAFRTWISLGLRICDGAAIGEPSIGVIFFAFVAGSAGSTSFGTRAAHPAGYADALTGSVAGALVFSFTALTVGLVDLRRTPGSRAKISPTG